MQVLNENYLISCGNWENSFQVISLNDGKIVQSIRQHKDVVSCVAGTSITNYVQLRLTIIYLAWDFLSMISKYKKTDNRLVNRIRSSLCYISNIEPFN